MSTPTTITQVESVFVLCLVIFAFRFLLARRFQQSTHFMGDVMDQYEH